MSDMKEQGVDGSVCCSQWCPDKDEHDNLCTEIEFVAKLAETDPSVIEGNAIHTKAVSEMRKEYPGTRNEDQEAAVFHVRGARKQPS